MQEMLLKIKMLVNILRSIRDKIRAARDPNSFARSLGVTVGKNVKFYGVSRGMFGSEPWLISIGNNCFITAGVQFVNHDGGTLVLRKYEPSLEWTAPISIGDDVYIGIRTTILPNVNIGNNCIIGACSLVNKSIPDNSVYAGVPARFICTIDEYFKKMENKSLGCGHLGSLEKAKKIREIYEKKGWFNRGRE